MGCETSKKDKSKIFIHKRTYFHNWTDEKINMKLNIMANNLVVTPLSLQDHFEMISKRYKKDINLENFSLLKNNFLKNKSKNVEKNIKLFEGKANEVQKIYRPERFDFIPNMLYHNKIDMFCKEKPEKTYVDLSSKYFKYMEFKVIDNCVIPIKIPKYFEHVIKEEILNMDFDIFIKNLFDEINSIATKNNKQNLYNADYQNINRINFLEKIIFLFSLEGYWYTEVNDFLKKSNFADQVFDINIDNIEPNNVLPIIEMNKKSKKNFLTKISFNNKVNINLNETNENNTNNKTNSELKKIFQFIENIKISRKLKDDTEFKIIKNQEELKSIKEKFNFNELERRNIEQPIKQEKNEISKQINNNICNDESYEESSEDDIGSDQQRESEYDKELEDIIKCGKTKNEIVSSMKSPNLIQELEKIKYSYISILAAVSYFSLNKDNQIFSELEISEFFKANGENQFEIKLYKHQIIKKAELENIILKKNQVRIHNEFISFYKSKNKSEEFMKVKGNFVESEKNNFINICYELSIPYLIQDDYFIKSKILGENTKDNFPINTNKRNSRMTINSLNSNSNLGDQDNDSNRKISTVYENLNINTLNKKSSDSKQLIGISKIDQSKFEENYFLNILSLMNTKKFSFFDSEEEILLNSGSLILTNEIEKNGNCYEIRASLINFSFIGFCEYLTRDPINQILNVSSNSLEIKESNTKALKNALFSLNKLTDIDLSYNQISDKVNKYFNNIIKGLENINTLKRINLSNNYLGKSKENIDLLSNILDKTNCLIYEISLSNNYMGIDNKAFEIFFNILKKNKSLEVLDLSDNNLNYNIKSLMILNEYLTKYEQLIELDLSYNNIGEDKIFVKLISYGIMGSKSLIKVDLSSNKLGINLKNNNNNECDNNNLANFNLILFKKKDNSSLKKIKNDSSINYLSEIFVFNKKLKEINLADNDLGSDPENLRIIFKNLFFNITLKKIDLSKNQIGISKLNMKYLRNFLIKNKNKLSLILDENEFINAKVEILIDGLEKSNNFISISLINNNLNRSEKFRKFIEEYKDIDDFVKIIY